MTAASVPTWWSIGVCSLKHFEFTANGEIRQLFRRRNIRPVFFKTTITILSKMAANARDAKIFLDSWVLLYKISHSRLTGNGPRLAGNFSNNASVALVTQLLTTTVYYRRTTGWPGRCNKTIDHRFQRYIREYQNDWDDYIQPLTFAYNAQVFRSTKTDPLSSTLTRKQLGSAKIVPSTFMS